MVDRNRIEFICGESHTMTDGKVLWCGHELRGVLHAEVDIGPRNIPLVILRMRADEIVVPDGAAVHIKPVELPYEQESLLKIAWRRFRGAFGKTPDVLPPLRVPNNSSSQDDDL